MNCKTYLAAYGEGPAAGPTQKPGAIRLWAGRAVRGKARNLEAGA